MNDWQLFQFTVVGVLITAVFVFVLLSWVSAPYGRHDRKGFGPRIPVRTGWIVMEAPTGHRFCVIGPQRPGFEEGANRWPDDSDD